MRRLLVLRLPTPVADALLVDSDGVLIVSSDGQTIFTTRAYP